MANGKNGRKNSTRELKVITLIVVILFIIANLKTGNNTQNLNENVSEDQQYKGVVNEFKKQAETKSEFQEENTTSKVDNKQLEYTNIDEEFIFTMIEGGQVDCFLLRHKEKRALIDCGSSLEGKNVVESLKDMGITKLDYVFVTYPDIYHMGGMYDIITNIDVDNIVMSKIEEKINSNWYTKLTEELYLGNYNIINPQIHDVYQLGESTIKIIGPTSISKESIDNYSIVIKILYREMSIILTGTANTEVEDNKSNRYYERRLWKICSIS